jgi:hypothetical protein
MEVVMKIMCDNEYCKHNYNENECRAEIVDLNYMASDNGDQVLWCYSFEEKE